MYDPTRLELIRSKEEDRRRALACATRRRQAKAQAHPRHDRGPTIRIAGLLRRTADRLEAPCPEERSVAVTPN
jgi:hypothetical protein